jgi:hypothetical protein
MKKTLMKEKEIDKLSQYMFVLDTLNFKLTSGKDSVEISKFLNSTAMKNLIEEMFYFY